MQKPRTRDIEQQIAQLRWRRQQNERLIRSSLEASKTLKQKDTILGLTVDQSSERELWTNSIVMDELSRPLVITDEQLHNIQYEEHKIQKRLWKYSKQQLDNVDDMYAKLSERKCRTEQGIEIQRQQLENLRSIRAKLVQNLQEIEQRVPYVDVKHVLKKIF